MDDDAEFEVRRRGSDVGRERSATEDGDLLNVRMHEQLSEDFGTGGSRSTCEMRPS